MSKSSRNVQLNLINRAKASKGIARPKVPKLHDENTKRQPLPRKSKATQGPSMIAGKRKAEDQNGRKQTKKRSAFGDITNAIGKTFNVGKKKEADPLEDEDFKMCMSQVLQLPGISEETLKNTEESEPRVSLDPEQTEAVLKDVLEGLDDSVCTPDQSEAEITVEDEAEANKENIPPVPTDAELMVPMPDGLEDYDAAFLHEPMAVAVYARDIFHYFRTRESKFVIPEYMSRQPYVSSSMRGVLVDWMVEVQESYELNHETLYLAVKLVDMYMSKAEVEKDDLQLLGSACLYISAKYDERVPPFVEDFLYICDDAYTKPMLLKMEQVVFKTLEFELGIPLSYRFLRRFARCSKVTMERLTLARFILERSLLDVKFISVSESLKAGASLVLACKLQHAEEVWSPALEFYSSLKLESLKPVVESLHQMLLEKLPSNIQTIDTKYSHELFFSVATLPIPDKLTW